MGLKKYFCVLLNEKKTINEVSEAIRNLKFEKLISGEFNLDIDLMNRHQNFKQGSKLDSIYSTQMSCFYKGEVVCFDIELIDGKKTYLFFGAATSYFSSFISENFDYFLKIFKIFPNVSAITFASEDDELVNTYSYDEMKKFREIDFYWYYISSMSNF